MDKAQNCQICESPARCRGWCWKHYTRWLRHGDPLFTMRRDGGVQGFESRVDRSGGPDACHLWQGCTDDHGYGVLQFNGRLQRGHQVAWQIINGDIPPDVHLDHECHNRAVVAGECRPGPCAHKACCNERHIVSKTVLQHVIDTPSRRLPQSRAHGVAILSERQVREIRVLLGSSMTRREIAEIYGVTPQAISSIRLGRTWGWLT